ncbi:PEP-CTERM sorting domain-containing protein [Aeoliella mucimassa]|nr:PEP-CTERM sorting domain-containing protein [Aeoliella mucimassa]
MTLALGGVPTAKAASVSWGAAFELVSVDDLDFSDTHILATNGGNDVGVQVAGVTFDNYISPNFSSVSGEPSWLTTDPGDGDFFSFNIAGVDVYNTTTGDDGLDKILATHMYGDAPLTELNHTIHGLTIGETYKVQVIGSADDRGVCCDNFVTHVDGGDSAGGVTIHRLSDLDADTVSHVTMAVGTFTADATTQQFSTIGQTSDGTPFGANEGLGGFSAVIVSSDSPFGSANVVANIDRSTGAITLTNTSTIGTANILAYSLTSAAGAFDHTEWKSIAENYDVDGPNTADAGAMMGSVDVDNAWTIYSAAGDDTDLSEGEFSAGDGGAIAPGQSVSLGNVWRQTPYEDVTAELLFDDGTIRTLAVTYSGDGIVAGDLDGNGVIDALDWESFKSGQGSNFATMSPARAYQLGNLQADNYHDLHDFALFEAAYDAANGPGALATLVSGVPEPSSCALLLLVAAGVCLGKLHRRRLQVLAVVAAVLLVIPSSASAVTVHWGPAFELTSVDDLDFSGTNIRAINGGNDVGIEIGGVSFDHYESPDFGAITGEPSWFTTTVSGGAFNGFAQSTLDVYSPTTGDAGLDVLLGAHAYADPPLTELTHVISGLTVGKSYQVQVIGQADNRGVCCDDFVTNIDGGEAAGGATIHRFVDLDSDDLKHVSTVYGTFTADATSVEFTTTGQTSNGLASGANQGHGGFSGLIVSEVETAKVFRMGLEVNTATGNIQLVNNTDAAIDFDSYQIRSAGTAPDYIGSLNEAGWLSIAERPSPIAGFPQSTGGGQGWEVGPYASANELVEWYLNDEGSESSLASGASINLGSAFDTSVGVEDLEFFYKLPSGAIVVGLVDYYSAAAIAGDYNGDNIVNLADYTIWRDTLGSSTDLRADGNGDSVVDASDYTVWKDNFGATASSLDGLTSPAPTAVPEPGAWLLMLIGLAAVITRYRCFESREHAFVSSAPKALILASGALIIAWATLGSTAQAMVTNDREYWFGEDGLEGASQGAIIGSSNSGGLATGYTADSKGPSMAYLDLLQAGDPTYENVGPSGLSRPGVAGTQYGARFDGEDSLLTGKPLNRPDELALLVQPSLYPIDYTGITSRGVQLWVYPDSESLGTGAQTLVFDTQVMGGPQISADGKWTQGNSQHTADNFNGFGAVPGDVSVVGDTWQHLMQHVYNKGDENAARIVSGSGTMNHIAVVYVDGVAVSANADNMPAGFDLTAQGFSGDLIVGAEDDGEGGYKNHFDGVIDDLQMYVFGNNETGSSGVLSDGEDWGTFDLFADNDWIAMEIANSVPGGVLEPGDVNKDGEVDSLDVDAFVLGWKYENVMTGAHSVMTVGDWNTWDKGDMNHDGITNLADAFILHQALVANTGVGLDFGLLADTTVPEPSSVVLLAIGAVMMAWGRQRLVRR